MQKDVSITNFNLINNDNLVSTSGLGYSSFSSEGSRVIRDNELLELIVYPVYNALGNSIAETVLIKNNLALQYLPLVTYLQSTTNYLIENNDALANLSQLAPRLYEVGDFSILDNDSLVKSFKLKFVFTLKASQDFPLSEIFQRNPSSPTI